MPKITARKYEGNDANSWAVFIKDIRSLLDFQKTK